MIVYLQSVGLTKEEVSSVLYKKPRCLKVLLVENDDSTRQVVSAPLHNCSYEVVAVANGQQAWKLLEDPSNHFDLVLTEIVMPCLSGINLLCKIMSCSTCKNISVIMMSSHDSMGTVFKCISKGAVDFLVKPVRKNELKNLWQHVWRRCQSSSDSGGETGSQTQKVTRPNGTADPDNNKKDAKSSYFLIWQTDRDMRVYLNYNMESDYRHKIMNMIVVQLNFLMPRFTREYSGTAMLIVPCLGPSLSVLLYPFL